MMQTHRYRDRTPRTVSVRILHVTARAAACTAVAAGAVGCGKNISDRDIQPTSIAEVKALTDQPLAERKVLLIDPRPRVDFAAGHIPGARWINLPDVSGRPDETDPALAKYSRLIVYGDDPGSLPARAMAKKLMITGYGDVKWFVGGLAEWRRSGFPVESGEK